MRMKLLLVLLLACVAVQWGEAGRAFPVESEMHAISLFQQINPSIEWDPTNFLVDLSGQYAQCKHVGHRGHVTVTRRTPENIVIGALVDSGAGAGTNAEIVNKYIAEILADWTSTGVYRAQISRADTFGCSVQPGCSGQVVIACLFAPEYLGDGGDGNQGEQPSGIFAKAFTPDEYDMAEKVVGMSWDRSHMIENLSGKETNCGMIGKTEWAFTEAEKEAAKRGMHLSPLFGSAPNTGSTPDAIEAIMKSWKPMSAKQVGCSVIPDCKVGQTMYVVVACLFRTS